MSLQVSEKSPLSYHSATTTMAKTPFGIEDILYLSNNNNTTNINNNLTNVNRNQLCAKNGLRIESDELKKSVER
jgi:hypothetical protein